MPSYRYMQIVGHGPALIISMRAAAAKGRPFASLRRNGGLLFWRLGRLGGSLYLSRARGSLK